jgi:hypothetical protein
MALAGCSGGDDGTHANQPVTIDTPIDVSTLPFAGPVDVATAGATRYSSYGCASSVDLGGPEVIHRVVVTESGLLAAEVSEGAVFLLRSNDPADCVSGGKKRAATFVEPGTYFVSVEAGSASAPSLSIAHTTPSWLGAQGMSAEVARTGLKAFSTAWSRSDSERLDYALVDFSMPSSERREWIVDLETSTLLWNLYVAHGWGSADPNDPARAIVFSNVPESHQSSLGMLRTAEPYVGDYGQSCRLDGLEPGYNDNVRPRDIVVHPWEESQADYVAANGMTGPTWGCPAIDDQLAPEVVARIAGGTLLWFWYPDGDWSLASTYLQ